MKEKAFSSSGYTPENEDAFCFCSDNLRYDILKSNTNKKIWQNVLLIL